MQSLKSCSKYNGKWRKSRVAKLCTLRVCACVGVCDREREREIIIFPLLKHGWKLDSKGIRVIHNDFNGLYIIYGLSWWFRGKEPTCQCRHGFDSWVRMITWRRKWQPSKSYEQRSVEGYSPWGHKRVRHDLATKQQQYSSGPYCQYTKLICAGPGLQ